MGNFQLKKSCCAGVCRNEVNFNDDNIKILKTTQNQIVKIQSFFRGFRTRLKLAKNSIYSKNRKTSQEIKTISVSGMLLDYSSEINIHPKVLEIEKTLGPFRINEKESKLTLNASLRKLAIFYNDNTFYKGQVNNSYQKEGYGVYYLVDGSKFEGFFMNDKMCGSGRLINITSEFYYEGFFQNNKANGFGRYVTFQGSIYVGYWKDDKQNGLGEEVYPDGSRYEGYFENGKKNGKGIFIFIDGAKYEGEFCNNLLQGSGTYIWNDGKIYQGTWFDNKMEGKGIFMWPDRKKYIGQYKNDKKQGYGIFIWPDDKKYEGMWVEGKQHGLGIITQNYSSQLGEWENGKILRIINQYEEEYEEKLRFLNTKKQQSNVFDVPEMKLRIL